VIFATVPYRMNEERQQRVVAAFNDGRKPPDVANEVGASEAAIISRAFRNIKAWGSCYPPELVKRGRPRILMQYHEDVSDVEP
jgi:hypothetical protein